MHRLCDLPCILKSPPNCNFLAGTFFFLSLLYFLISSPRSSTSLFSLGSLFLTGCDVKNSNICLHKRKHPFSLWAKLQPVCRPLPSSVFFFFFEGVGCWFWLLVSCLVCLVFCCFVLRQADWLGTCCIESGWPWTQIAWLHPLKC